MIDDAFIEFINEIEKARVELRCSKGGAFYRGHYSVTHRLIPSIFRGNFNPDIEHNLYVDSYARGKHLIKNSKNSWEFLSIMQHFGIPTRLLDWSESLSTALFFALDNLNPEPVIWITNPFILNRANKASKIPRILTIGLDEFPDYESCFVRLDNEIMWKFQKPIFIQVPWTNERILNQKGFFTVHTTAEPMEESCEKFVRCVPIKKEAILGVKRFLEYAGINEDTVFPDLDGFGRFLKKRYKV
jgi:hypothetical protein